MFFFLYPIGAIARSVYKKYSQIWLLLKRALLKKEKKNFSKFRKAKSEYLIYPNRDILKSQNELYRKGKTRSIPNFDKSLNEVFDIAQSGYNFYSPIGQ
jgi:hypothetical protein